MLFAALSYFFMHDVSLKHLDSHLLLNRASVSGDGQVSRRKGTEDRRRYACRRPTWSCHGVLNDLRLAGSDGSQGLPHGRHLHGSTDPRVCNLSIHTYNRERAWYVAYFPMLAEWTLTPTARILRCDRPTAHRPTIRMRLYPHPRLWYRLR